MRTHGYLNKNREDNALDSCSTILLQQPVFDSEQLIASLTENQRSFDPERNIDTINLHWFLICAKTTSRCSFLLR